MIEGIKKADRFETLGFFRFNAYELQLRLSAKATILERGILKFMPRICQFHNKFMPSSA